MSVETGLNKLNLTELRAVGRLLFITEPGLTKQEFVHYVRLRLEAPQLSHPRINKKQQRPKQTPRRSAPDRRSTR